MRLFLRPMAGLLLFEALLALWVLSGVAVGLLTLQGRTLAQSQGAQLRGLVTAEAGALVAGMRTNAQFAGSQPHWRHYQGQASCGAAAASRLVDSRGMAQRQLCRLEAGLTQRLAGADFAYAVCPLTAAPWPQPDTSVGPVRLACPAGARADGWVLYVAWRFETEGFVYALPLSAV
ncbi:MAG: hypothetical protein KBC57_13135 [Neisseriaceae bacterium]|nr:hypothetical protein [Neisseriaceae bacterium]MBP6863284.1 hypothetical protein [Neisseriaceae bacterium]